MTDAERCPVHPSVALVDAPGHDVGRICPRCESERRRERQAVADGGHDLESPGDGDEGDADTATPRIDDAVATVTHPERVDAAATLDVSGGLARDGAEYVQTVELRVGVDGMTIDVELTRPAAAVFRAALDDALLEAEELAAAHR